MLDDWPMEPFHEGQKVWVEQSDGSQRAATFVGEVEAASWFGGAPGVYVVYEDTHAGEAVAAIRVVPRDE
jgi:hypothetical protein